MQAPGLWDDQERAARVSAEHSAVQRRLESYRSLETDVDDLEALEEMAAEDDSIAAELEEQRRRRGAAGRARGGALFSVATTPATPSSLSTPAPAGPTPRTGPRCCRGCSCANASWRG